MGHLKSAQLRKFRAAFRDTKLLFRQFRWQLIIFISTVLGGGFLYHHLAVIAQEPVGTISEAIYHVLGLTFLNPIEPFPLKWYLAVFYFAMPLIGIGILAQGIADFGVFFFNRSKRSKEWETAVASTFNNHNVLIGLGHLGFRVANELYRIGQEIVVIEQNPDADLVTSLREMDIPIIVEDGSRETALQAANIKNARTIILCTQDDSLNLQMALKARSLAPKIKVILRIFDDDFAKALENQFGFRAISTTGTASPLFAAAASGVDITRPLTIEGQAFCLASFNVTQNSKLIGKVVGEIEESFDVSVVLLRRGMDKPDYHPASHRQINLNDTLAIFGGSDEIQKVILNQN
jgi:Trk K+ transport system NAD-binding subunit